MKRMTIKIDSKDRRDFALNLIKNIRQDDCPIELIIQPYVEKRSDPQRGLFHAGVRELASETGYTEAEVKELVKKIVLGTRVVKIGGIEKEVTSSSEQDDEGKPRTKPSYSELLEGLFKIASEAGIKID